MIAANDGDRIMAVFIGDSKNSSAVRTALKVNFAVERIFNPAIVDIYPRANYSVKHSVGIDTSDLFVARTGIRGSNDLVWVGRAANYAATLSGRSGPATQVTAEVYNQLHQSCIVGGNGQKMWIQATAPEIGHKRIHTSSWIWEV